MAGQDYPRTYREFVRMFPDDPACVAYVERLRWPEGFVCPSCRVAAAPWRQTRGRLVCGACRHQASVTAGTIFDKTRTPLTTWFEAAWHVTTAKNGLSAKTLEQTLGTSYRTAWAMLQRFRVAMVRTERDRLSGEIEVDETLIGGVERGGKRGRGTTKSLVVIAVEIKQPKGFGRVRMRHVPDASGARDHCIRPSRPSEWSLLDSRCRKQKARGSNHGYTRKKIIVASSDDPARCRFSRRRRNTVFCARETVAVSHEHQAH